MMGTGEKGVEGRSAFGGIERSGGMRNRTMSLLTIFLFVWGAHGELLQLSSLDALQSFNEMKRVQVEEAEGWRLFVLMAMLCLDVMEQIIAYEVHFVGNDGQLNSSSMLARWK